MISKTNFKGLDLFMNRAIENYKLAEVDGVLKDFYRTRSSCDMWEGIQLKSDRFFGSVKGNSRSEVRRNAISFLKKSGLIIEVSPAGMNGKVCVIATPKAIADSRSLMKKIDRLLMKYLQTGDFW
jgi:hypothetical protein